MIGFETKQLRAFVGVAQTKSFTLAAGALAISRPALSLQIAKFEKLLGFTLFERTTRAVMLTPEGAHLLPYAERALTEQELLDLEVRKLRKGSGLVQVGTALHTSRWALRNRILDEFPKIYANIKLQVQTGVQKDLISALESGRIDAVLFGGISTTRADFQQRQATERSSEGLYPDDLPCVMIERRRLELLIPIESPLAAEPIITQAMLVGLTVSVPHPRSCPPLYGGFARFLERAGGTVEFVPDHNAYSLDQFCRRSRKITLSPGQFIDEPQMVDIVSRHIEGFETCCELALISRADDRSPALRSLVSFARSIALAGGRVGRTAPVPA